MTTAKAKAVKRRETAEVIMVGAVVLEVGVLLLSRSETASRPVRRSSHA
jgi:hypothetical protein